MKKLIVLSTLCILLLIGLPAAAQAASQTVTWQAPTTYSDGSPIEAGTVLSYTVYYGTSAGVYTGTVSAGNVLTYTVTGLTAGIKYYFAISCTANAVESSRSNEVAKTPPFIATAAPVQTTK